MSLSEIDPSSLADILKRSNGRLRKLLIIDCRCFIDYNDSHIRSAINAFYSKLVRRRLQENKVCALQQLLSCAGDEKARLVALSGEEGDNVELDLVLYDHQTEMPTEPATSECPSQPAVHTPAVKSLFNGQMVTPCAVSRMKRAMRCKKTESSLLTDSSKFIALLLDKLRKSNAFNQVLVLKG
uniref:Rhodanese domain-containing protein n=1 Tax=Plectus sambesii TaxID=2011161 RepID=A0A914VEI8_9BILA